ncbi:DUF4856 domain-containing protein [Telluribacter sp.]|jgi:hypothetical protein|uniref:DUF4856 domain-containing protein n=1 Tax=Telluribacter sp. TaxID=1978767 RepID=UPI002E11CA07|nr:DUF4856 domain-containing protein [Telluribacter sp.]
MSAYSLPNRSVLFFALSVFGVTACNETVDPRPDLRPSIDYTQLSATTPYSSLFVDQNGASTVDLTTGNARINAFRALDAYAKTVTAAGATTPLDASQLKNMYANSGNPFSGTYASLNGTGIQLRDATAVSTTNPESERKRMDDFLVILANKSKALTTTAEDGKAGKLGTYLVDEQGIEWGQIVAKSLIGAYQLDYIGNVLLSEGLKADNYTLVAGKPYTQLEHNWDQAYANFTQKPVYAGDASATSNGGEAFLGAYVWEYNKEGYPKLHQAFLKGRAAIVNNDAAVYKEQAELIRKELEKTIANSSIGYLKKTRENATDPARRAHAYSEGLGFIYSLRYAKLAGADAAFSDAILNKLAYTSQGMWKVKNEQLEEAIRTISTKFGIN